MSDIVERLRDMNPLMAVACSGEAASEILLLRQQLATTERLLAESQAREFSRVLQLQHAMAAIERNHLQDVRNHVQDAINVSVDPTALDAAIAAAKEPLEYQIDTLMQEYCPDEITSEQWARIEAHTRVSDGADELKGGGQNGTM